MLKKTDEFWIVTEKGDKYLIFEYTNYIESSEFGRKGYVLDIKEFKTSKGMRVNELKEGKYQIVQLDVIGKKN